MSAVRTASEMEGDTSYAKRSKTDFEEVTPSKVLHVRNIAEDVNENELYSYFAKFGTVKNVFILYAKRQAFVEMATVPLAAKAVTQCQAEQAYINNRKVFVNYSKSQEIDKKIQQAQKDRMAQNQGYQFGAYSAPGASGASGAPGALAAYNQPYGQQPAFGQAQGQGQYAYQRNGRPEGSATPILLVSVLNAMYPITTEVLYSVFSPLGQVLRIVIFRKAGHQAFIEFDSTASSSYAKQNLDGANMYPGCNTLKIEFSKTNTLNVKKNDDFTYDYTTGQPGMGGYDSYNNGYGREYGGRPGALASVPTSSGGVVMVYGMGDNSMEFNCEKLFNLFCLYGTVTKIKFLKSKKGVAMVQMGDMQAVDVAIQYLNNIALHGCKLSLTHSKAPFIAGNSTSNLEDNTPDVVDYSSSLLNRFSRPSTKNRIYRPSKVLHFFNAPPNTTREMLNERFLEKCGITICDLKLFDKGPNPKSTSGLLEFSTVDDSVKAVATTNHTVFRTQEEREFTFKLAFSSAPSANKEGANSSENLVTSTGTNSKDLEFADGENRIEMNDE